MYGPGHLPSGVLADSFQSSPVRLCNHLRLVEFRNNMAKTDPLPVPLLVGVEPGAVFHIRFELQFLINTAMLCYKGIFILPL